MVLLLVVILILFVLSFSMFGIGVIEYRKYINKLAKTNTLEYIEKRIKERQEDIERGIYKGIMLENLLDEMEMWQQVRNCKLKMEDEISR